MTPAGPLITLRVLVVLSGLLASTGALHAQNLAQGRPYTLSSAPNYATATAGAETVLTDGGAGWGLFWRNGTALGWSWRSTVTITVPLAAPSAIGRVRVAAGAKRGGEAYYPSMMLVYGADAGGQYAYLGASTLQRDDESPHDGTIRWFEIGFPARRVEKVAIVVFARGAFTWLSEIEVHAATAGDPAQGAIQDTIAAADIEADAARRRRAAIAALPIPQPTGPHPAERWAMPIGATAAGDAAPATGCAIERIEPWPDLPRNETVLDAAAPLILAPGGADTAAFRLTNRGAAPAEVSVSGDGDAGIAIRWHALAHVRAPDLAWTADVATPFTGASLPPHSTMIVLAEIEASQAAPRQVDLALSCGANSQLTPIPVRVIESAAAQTPLHGTQWVYLHQPTQAQIASALACEPGILARFGIDSQVVHPDALLDKDTARPDALLARYLMAFRDARRILLYMDVKTRPWAFKAMPDDEAARALGAWWSWLRQAAEKAGVKGELLLYPIDEPQPGDVPLLLRTRDLLRRAGITAPVYATVEHKTARLLADLDIVQLHRPTRDLRAAAGRAEVHSYFTRHDGLLQSPHRYYRTQGWQAHALDLKGIGVWALWDSTGAADPESGWDMFVGGRERDFGLLYQGRDGCARPSRRLLAWRRGIEEHRLLRACVRTDAHRQIVDQAIATGNTATVRTALDTLTRNCQ